MNIGRGPTVNEGDLCQALRQKMIAGAVLDVFEEEPLKKESTLWAMPNVLIYPHSADLDSRKTERALKQFTDHFEQWKEGHPFEDLVDKTKGF